MTPHQMIAKIEEKNCFAQQPEHHTFETSLVRSCKDTLSDGGTLSEKQRHQLNIMSKRGGPVAFMGKRSKCADDIPPTIVEETISYAELAAETTGTLEDEGATVRVNGFDVDRSASNRFFKSKIHAPSILLEQIPEQFRPRAISASSSYPNGRFEYPYPSEDIMGGAMFAVRNNPDGATAKRPMRFHTPGRDRVGDRSNAPYLPPPQDDSGELVLYEGQGKILCGYSHGQNTIGIAGAWNFRKGGEESDPAREHLNPMIVAYIQQYNIKKLTIVPDPNAFDRADIGTAYVEFCLKLKAEFKKSLKLVIRRLPDAIDDLTDQMGVENPQLAGESKTAWSKRCFDLAWGKGHEVPVAALKCRLIRVFDDPCFPHPLKVTQNKDKSRYVTFHDVNAALILQYHPRMAGRIRYDMSHSMFLIDGMLMKEVPAAIGKIGHELAYDVLWDHNGVVIETSKLKTAVISMMERVGFYPMQELVAALPEWDGVGRLANIGVQFCGFEDNDWSRLWFESFVLYTMYRGLNPGAICRFLFLLQGGQQIGKTTLPSTLFGSGMSAVISEMTHGGTIDFDELLRRMYQAGHVAVLDDIETIPLKYRSMLKQLISAGSNMIPEQVRYLHIGERTRVRHFTMFATTNSEAVIPEDLTGNFRICAARSLNENLQKFDFEGISAVREQVLAEAYHHVSGMTDADWSKYEDKVTSAVEEGSAWALAENSNYRHYAMGLKSVLDTAISFKAVSDWNTEIGAVFGEYNGVSVTTIKLASLQEAIRAVPRAAGSVVYMKDLENWLKSEGWKHSPTEVVRRRRVWFRVENDE